MKIIPDKYNGNNNSAANRSGQEQQLPFPTADKSIDRLEEIRQQIFKSHEGVMAICKQANVPTSIRNLIGALIKLSKGEIVVRANDFEVANVFYEDESQRDALKKKVQRWRKALDKWQTKTEITLVQFRSGYQTTVIDNKGLSRKQNEPTEYHLIVLDLAAKVIAMSSQDVDWSARAVLGNLPNLSSRLDEVRKNPLTIDRCFNTSTSWIKKTLELARRDGELEEVLRDLQAEFQTLIDEFLIEDDEEGGTHASYLELNGETLLDTRSTINTSYSFNKDVVSFNKDVVSIDNSDDELENSSYQRTSNITTADCIKEEVSPDAEFNSEVRILSNKTANFSMLEQALSHAKRGFCVFPVYKIINGACSCRYGEECPTPAKHPCITGWNTQATTDETQIRKWWRRLRNANIGIATGDYTDEQILVVLDVDTKADGFESLESLEKEFGQLPETLTAITGSKGRHFIFLAQRGLDIRNLQASQKLGKGLDVRGLNGFIVAVGSVHASGNRYEWVDGNAPIAEMPEWMVEKLTTPVSFRTQVASTSGNGSNTAATSFSNFNNITIVHEHEGRNNFLFVKALHFFRNGYDRPTVEKQISSLNSKICEPPVGRIEMEKLIYSAEERYQLKP